MGGGDALDVRILYALFQSQGLTPINTRIRTSVRTVASQLGVSEGTVRNRIARLRETGFVKEMRLIPNPTVLGLGQANVIVEVPPERSKDDIADELLLLEDTVIVAVFQSRLVATVFRHRGEAGLARRIDLIRKLAKVDRALVGRVAFPACGVRLSASDWTLLRSLHPDPTRSYASVARELGVSSRTVKRKLERLLRGYAAFVWPIFDVSQSPRGVTGTVLVQYPISVRGDVDRQVLGRFGDFIFTVFPMLPYRDSDPALCSYNVIVPNVPRGNEILREVRGIPGVRSASLEWFERIDVNYEPSTEDLRNAST